jgi:hypothetical protein
MIGNLGPCLRVDMNFGSSKSTLYCINSNVAVPYEKEIKKILYHVHEREQSLSLKVDFVSPLLRCESVAYLDLVRLSLAYFSETE